MSGCSFFSVRSQNSPSCPVFTPNEKFMSSSTTSTCSSLIVATSRSVLLSVTMRVNTPARQIFKAVSIAGLSSTMSIVL